MAGWPGPPRFAVNTIIPTTGVSPAALSGLVQGLPSIREEAWVSGTKRAKVDGEASRKVRNGWEVERRIGCPEGSGGRIWELPIECAFPEGSSPSGCSHSEVGNDENEVRVPRLPWTVTLSNQEQQPKVSRSPTESQPDPFGPLAAETSWIQFK